MSEKGNLKANYIYQASYQILVIILPFITSPYISRVLRAEGVGIYSYTYSVVFYFGLFAYLGINNYGNRSIAKVRDDKTMLSETFSSIFFLHILLTIIAIISYWAYCFFVVKVNRDIAYIQLIYLFNVLFDINWFYFGLEKFKLTVTRNAIIKVLTVISIFIFVRTSADLRKYTLIMASGTLIGQVPLWLLLKKYVTYKMPRCRDVISHIKPMITLFIAAIAVSIYIYIAKIMLGSMSSMREVGFYENANKMIDFPVGLVTALGIVMLPRMSNLFKKGRIEEGKNYIKKSMSFAMIFSSAIACGVAAISSEFSIVFWGAEFGPSGLIMLLLSINVIFISWNNVIRTQYLIPLEKDIVYLVSVWAGAIIDIVVNLFLIPRWGGYGAAIGTVSAYSVVCLLQTYPIRKELPVYEYLKDSLPFFTGGIIMCCVVICVGNMLSTGIVVKLVVKVICGMIFYSGFVLIYANSTKNEVILSLIEEIKNSYLKIKKNGKR